MSTKTPLIKIDEATTRLVDHLLESKALSCKNRGEIIRFAVQRLVEEMKGTKEDQHERIIFSRQREPLNRQAAALIKEQAD